jgi:hypothetical protein
MTITCRWFLALAAIAAAGASSPSLSSAQGARAPVPDPWKVTVRPGLNPLAIGFCAAVDIEVLEASGRDVPRNPTGFRVTIADFDMAVSGASVVGWQVDASHWQVCACQGGSAGTVATVTATYPAKALDAKARVPGVSFQRTATFSLSAPKGTTNPPACMNADRPAIGASPPTVPPVATTGTALERVAARTPARAPAPVTVTFVLSAKGSWYEPGPMALSFPLKAAGSWYEPSPVTLAFGLSASGTWIERAVR